MLLSQQQLGVFDRATIQKIVDILATLPDAPNSVNPTVSYNNGFEPGDPIYPLIHQLVVDPISKAINRPLHLTHGMLLKALKPYRIHTDYIKGDSLPDLAILVPLNLDPIDTHTVVFNEFCIDNFENFLGNNSKLAHNAAYLHDTLCSHETRDRLEHVSLLAAYKWLPGSFFYWDRALLHCSDNFLSNGIETKQALVLFTHKLST